MKSKFVVCDDYRTGMLKVETWMLSTLFSLGVIAGMVWLNLSNSGAARIADEEAAAAVLESETPQPFSTSLTNEPGTEDKQFAQSARQQGDRYLLAGNYELALENYLDAASILSPDESSVLLREAFCCELMGRQRVAGKKYYRSITNASNQNHLLLATAGYGRCLFREANRAEAVKLISDHMLKLNDYESVPTETRSWLSLLHTQLLVDRALHPNRDESSDEPTSAEFTQDLTLPNEVVFDDSPISPELFLEVIDQPCDTGKEPPSNPNEISITLLQRPTASADLISLSVRAKLQPITSLAAIMSEKASLNLSISPAAVEKIRHRSRTIHQKSASLSVLLDSLLVPFDLVWFQNESDIQVLAMQEIKTNKKFQPLLENYRFDAADRALSSFELEYQTSKHRHATMLARGNLGLVRKQYDAAANRYQELELALPTAEMLAHLFFNQAKLQLLLNNGNEARRLLYLAIDQTVNANIESSSYCLLSSSLLTTSDMNATITAARRAIATAIDSRQIRWASLNLARAYLLDNNPFAANDALFRAREELLKPDQDNALIAQQRQIAALLGAYARFRGVSDQRRIMAERNRLLTSIAMIENSAFQSFTDGYISARAYRELGFTDRAIEKMILSLARPDLGQWQRQLMFELGQLQQEANLPNDATNTFELLTKLPDRWRTLALERLIKLHSDANRLEDCIAACKQLWDAGPNEEQKRSTLQFLGKAYQKQGEHHAAALCFAGMMPGIL